MMELRKAIRRDWLYSSSCSSRSMWIWRSVRFFESMHRVISGGSWLKLQEHCSFAVTLQTAVFAFVFLGGQFCWHLLQSISESNVTTCEPPSDVGISPWQLHNDDDFWQYLCRNSSNLPSRHVAPRPPWAVASIIPNAKSIFWRKKNLNFGAKILIL